MTELGPARTFPSSPPPPTLLIMVLGYVARKKDTGKHLPPELAAQWARDREKKAERRQQRELERLIAAADPLSPKKTGKKARKAMRAAQSSSLELPNRVFDVNSLEAQITICR